MAEPSGNIKDILNVGEEDQKELVEFANKEKAILIAIIAPYTRVRVSPIEEKSAYIGLSEEFGVERAIRGIKKKNKSIEKAFILLNSRGGAVESSYKIAKCLRDNFKEIKIFVPHMAASGGTLIALTGNEIIMGMMSALSPLDVQTDYGDDEISVSMVSMFRSFDVVEKKFEKLQAAEAPYPWTCLAGKFDPVIMFEWRGALEMMNLYIKEILIKSGFDEDKAKEITENLIWKHPSHEFVIDYDKAKAIGLNVKKDTDYEEAWGLFQLWLDKYIMQATDKHVIRYIVPETVPNAIISKKIN
jgi:ClpP class serine protease